MNVWIGVLTAVEVVVAILLITVILIQPSKAGGGLGSVGGGVAEQVFGATAGNVLTKTTVWLSAIFMIITLALVVLGAHRQAKAGKSMVEGDALVKPPVTAPAKATGTATTVIPVKVKADGTTAVKAEAAEAVKVQPVTAPVVPVPAKPAAPAVPATQAEVPAPAK